MASVTIQKHAMQETITRQVGHIYREHINYSNPDIQLSQSGENTYFGDTAQDVRTRLQKTLEDVDTRKPPQRIRKDRKTVVELCVPAPREGMDDTAVMMFFSDYLQELRANGDLHICGAAVHADEVHAYTDHGELHESRLHLHVLAIPENSKGCNMKSWLTRDRYGKINALADKSCEKVLGYAFQDGSKARSRGSVEQLKVKAAVEAVGIAEAARISADVSLQVSKKAQAAADLAETRRAAAEFETSLERQRLVLAKDEHAHINEELQATRQKAAEAAQKAVEAAQRQADDILQAAQAKARQERDKARQEVAAARRELESLRKQADKLRQTDAFQKLQKNYTSLQETCARQKRQIAEQVDQIHQYAMDRDESFSKGQDSVFRHMTEDEERLVKSRMMSRHHGHSR